MRLPTDWTPHAVLIDPYGGEGANGPVFGEQVILSPETGNGVYTEDVQEVITDSSGREVVSSGRVHCSFEDAPLSGSRITVWPGRPFERTSIAIKVSRFEHPDWPGYGVVYLK